MANTIYRGPIDEQPKTISLPVTGALTPGVFVASTGSALAATTDAGKRLLLLSNREFYDQTDDGAYESGDTGVAFPVRPEQEFRAQVAADTYAYGAALTLTTGGVLAAATDGDIVVAFYDQADATLGATTLADVVIASKYTVPTT
jgi:hypothetical protein